jgi:tetratricopeptide (TPR) repeat protein
LNREEQVDEAIKFICDRLTERTATLFLGAGVNYGITNNAGEQFPLGQALADWVARDLLNSGSLGGLDETAEIARLKFGSEALNNYLYDKFSTFQPGSAQLALIQLPWDCIFTTNFDRLVEQAADSGLVKAAGIIKVICSEESPVEEFSENDIVYYKLHCTIDLANTQNGRLILTKEDYRHYLDHRVRLFKRLKRDLARRTFLFVGYSMVDNNFRETIEECKNELDVQSFPLSFAIRPKFSDVHEVFWKEKYNVQLLDVDGAVFLNRIKEFWELQNCTVAPFAERQLRKYGFADEATTFEKVGESFHLLNPNDITGTSDAHRFFRGGSPSWADIRDRVAPPRELYWALFDPIFDELASPTAPSSCYLVTGAAGTGKTTLLRTMAFDLAKEFGATVLLHIPGTPLETRFLGTVMNKATAQRIFIVIESAAEKIADLEKFISEIREKALPITILIEERKNQWLVAASNMRTKKSVEPFEFEKLSRTEIVLILAALEKHDCLDKLAGMAKEEQIEHFENLAEKDLLVALRELTSASDFDAIIKDEYQKIPNDVARSAYAYVSALGRIDLSIRYETLQHILNIDYVDLKRLVFEPAQGVLISCEERGNSRYNAGFRLRTRHPVIATVIFDEAAEDDSAKFEILNRILTQLDTGYSEDKAILFEIVRTREIVNAFASADVKRAIYDRLAVLMPKNQYVYQHRAILEKELGDGERSEHFARIALRMDESNPALMNTLGLSLEFRARKTKDMTKRLLLLAEAKRLFDAGLARHRDDPFAHLGKFYVLQQQIELEDNLSAKEVLVGSALALLEEALETTDGAPVIAKALGHFKQNLGNLDEAVRVVSKSLEKNAANTRLRDALIRMKLELRDFHGAYDLATEGLKLDPQSWRMERHVARTSVLLNKPPATIKPHYSAAVRLNKGDLSILVEFGAWLYMIGDHDEASRIFEDAKKLPGTSGQKLHIRNWFTTVDGAKRKFSGKVQHIKAPGATVISIPENYVAFFRRNRRELTELREGDAVDFEIGFNALGPYAEIKLNPSS